MARAPLGWTAPLAALLLVSSPLGAQDLAATITALGERVCSLDSIPAGERHLLASALEHRAHLYLRCELKGRDEFVRTVCCEHLSQADGQALGVCPTNPTTERVLRDYKSSRRC